MLCILVIETWALLEVHQTVGKAYFESGFLDNKLNSKSG
jgi:hypothetical protein